MRKLLLLLAFLTCISSSFAQNPTYQQKLYYTCKIWGFVKYYHSAVSNCQLNWDSVLISSLPAIKNSITKNDFNNALDSMLAAAGPMALSTTYFPDTLPVALKRNRNFGWINDTLLRNDVQIILDTIKNNFRPHAICWVQNNTYTSSYGGWLVFPYDSLMNNTNFATSYPNEWNRLLTVFKHWNIINYFNPYNYVQDKTWDSTLYNNIADIAGAGNYQNFVKAFKKMTKAIDDAHVEGLTWTNYYLMPGFYPPALILGYVQNKYVVVKSGLGGISKGDEIVSVDGLTTLQWEDSLGTYVSAGNPSVFRRFMCQYLIAGAYNSTAVIVTKDSMGTNHSSSVYRNQYPYDTSFFNYYPNDTLRNTAWKTINCGVGYVNMGILQQSDVNSMYAALRYTPAIIFDIRNYPNGTAWPIADLMYPDTITFADFTVPDVTYPGTYSWQGDQLGIHGNGSRYNGKVILLFNEETQSQAEFTCMILGAMPNVVKIGSQTAGTDGNITYFQLSQDLHTGFTTLGTFYPNGDSTERIGIRPDSLVSPTQIGIRHNRDEVLEKAIQIGCALSVPNINSTQSTIKIYPNPATDLVNIEAANINSDNVTISITDVTGKILLLKDLSVINQNVKATIDIRSFAPGLYILTIKAGAEQKVIKLIKK